MQLFTARQLGSSNRVRGGAVLGPQGSPPPKLYITGSPMQSGMKPVWVLGIIMFTSGGVAHVIGIMMAGT